MSVGPFDGVLTRDLFTEPEIATLFSDSAEVRAMMLVLGALARVQGEAGVIPEVSGRFLHRAAMEVQVDPGALTTSVGVNAVSVPGLVAAMRDALQAPEHAQYLQLGATSQDIQDSALMLRMRRASEGIEARIDTALLALADLAEGHAETVQAARTYGQDAVPSTFGALVAAWGAPFLRAKARLDDLRARVLCVSLSGAAGTGVHLGTDPGAIRGAFAGALGLGDPGVSWHAERSRIAELSGWLTGLTAAGGKMGEDLLRLCRSDVGEVRLAGSGASSTMPQKQNPVGPSVLVALSQVSAAQGAVLAGARHGEARDGAAWIAEWMVLPGLVMAAAKAAALSGDLAGAIEVDAARMAGRVADPQGLIHAEALSFALAAKMPRGQAQTLLRTLAGQAYTGQRSLVDLVAEHYPELDLSGMSAWPDLGMAPGDARSFGEAARKAVQGSKT